MMAFPLNKDKLAVIGQGTFGVFRYRREGLSKISSSPKDRFRREEVWPEIAYVSKWHGGLGTRLPKPLSASSPRNRQVFTSPTRSDWKSLALLLIVAYDEPRLKHTVIANSAAKNAGSARPGESGPWTASRSGS